MRRAPNGNVYGWCCYDTQLGWSQHLAAVREYRPGTVRVFISLDRITNATGRNLEPSTAWAKAMGDAANVIRGEGGQLVPQFAMKKSDWSANDPGNPTGATWLRADARHGWFRNPADYGRMVDAVLDILGPCASVGAWNEPDWAAVWWWQDRLRAVPEGEWANGPWIWPPQHAFGWTGGVTRLQQHRDMVRRTVAWNSDGINVAGSYWRPTWEPGRTSVSVADLHSYQTSAANHLAYLARYTATMPPVPFFIGELGYHSSQGTAWDDKARTETATIVETLAATHGEQFAGICLHTGGSRYPMAWETGPVPRWM